MLLQKEAIILNKMHGKHQAALPTPRKIRRGCSKELYRTIKRLGVYIPEDLLREGEALYYKKVIANLLWIGENSSNRKVLADWWDEEVGPELAELWGLDTEALCKAFRAAFGG
ncbi:dehydrogenase [Paenibacillus ihumii]|uniref:dehydrogenase n=1 Tax=Paenibacillus ihumii TaxID=687436 RepID=UPI000AE4723D|nr:dehydrogenase [Paenibacillus ihumii]